MITKVTFAAERVHYNQWTRLSIGIIGDGTDWRNFVDFPDGMSLCEISDALISLGKTVKERADKGLMLGEDGEISKTTYADYFVGK